MTMMRSRAAAGLLALGSLALPGARTFAPPRPPSGRCGRASPIEVATAPEAAAPEVGSGFIDGELRGAAMRLHTRAQAPKEGKAPATKHSMSMGRMPTTLEDYAQFLVDSREVYAALEEAAGDLDDLMALRETGLERTDALAVDLEFLTAERSLAAVPQPGPAGTAYAAELRRLAAAKAVPEFVCHYYNHYFAHTAGGRMIGKQMSKLLLDGHTLQFYQWPADGALSDQKPQHLLDPVRDEIERMAAAWSEEERGRCVDETANTFKYGGSLNRILMGSGVSHGAPTEGAKGRKDGGSGAPPKK